ncbi:MAG: tRNA (adenosine(37)-N6)-threonylcarbamoyltransferase complex dimerization subunit type 1 TsaB [Ruminococcaceae bacterium]|nr:tRNA (adenosine(37)-N6)-threonylcarbamoyltransferase complex dimerization subunit type 1 TsaB [Oscillospiraceae bacterium]
MKILALDSSALIASVALCEDGKLLSEYTLNNKNTHSETLLPMIESMLSHFSMTLSDIDLFAASAGPGSFTGVRIGAATLKGLAFGSEKPCVEVSTLEALACNLLGFEGLICPVMNARRSQVYTALFRSDGKTLTRLMDDSAMAISELDELLSKYEERVMLCGDGYDITVQAFNKTEIKYTPERLRHQSAFSVACVALELYGKGEHKSDTAFKVNYLRPSQAERELMNKNKETNED